MPDPTNSLYNLRDAQGNVYGPAPIAQIREWSSQGRLARTMFIAPENSNDWQPITQAPQTATLFGGPTLSSAGAFARPGSGAPTMPENPGYATAPGTGRPNPYATAGMMFGITALLGLCTPAAPLILGITALVFGLKAKAQMRAEGAPTQGRATAAIVLGILGILAGIILIIVTSAVLIAKLQHMHGAFGPG